MNKENKILMKNNKIANAKYESKLIHNKIFVYLLYNFQKHTNEDKLIHEVKREELAKLILRQNERTLKGLRKTLDDLRSKSLHLVRTKEDGSRDYITAGFIDKFIYNDKSDTFKIVADAEVHRLLHKYIEDGYTPVNLEVWLSLKNTYAQRFYDLLRMWSGTKDIINYKLEHIREILLLENKYKVYADFKKRVLIPAIEELNNTGYFEIEFEEKRLGRTIDSIDFIVKDLDKRIYFNKKEKQKEIELEGKEITDIVPNNFESMKNKIDELYIPNKKLFTAKTLNDFANDFKDIDFKDKNYKKLLQDAIMVTLDKDDSEKIYVKSYNYFKKTLENKLNNLSTKEKKNEFKKTKFHNFDETFTRYSEDEFENIILESQKKKFG